MSEQPCPHCDDNGVITVAVGGPDYFGNYDTDEVECDHCGPLAQALARDEREADDQVH